MSEEKGQVINMNKKLIIVISVFVVCAALFIGFTRNKPEEPEEPLQTPEQTPVATSPTTPTMPPPAPSQVPPANVPEPPVRTIGRIILATTASVDDTGLLAFILPAFTADTGWEVDIVAADTGAALQMGKDGGADVLLVQSRPDEDRFVADGFGDNRYDVMYNNYVVVGPKNGLLEPNDDIEATFRTIIETGLGFVSRGDGSDTYSKEMSIWGALGMDPIGNPLYLSIGQGMVTTLGVTKELNIYTLSDRATWLKQANKGELEIVCEGHPTLNNPFGVIPVSGSVNEEVNTVGGKAFADWIISPSAQQLIAQYGAEEFGQPLFFPSA